MIAPDMVISELGEKRLIAEVLRPLFNPEDDPRGVGDDCAVITHDAGTVVLVSTDRVPADLIALRTGVIDFRGFGAHVAAINASDIAACGGRLTGFLLNCGLPADF